MEGSDLKRAGLDGPTPPDCSTCVMTSAFLSVHATVPRPDESGTSPAAAPGWFGCDVLGHASLADAVERYSARAHMEAHFPLKLTSHFRVSVAKSQDSASGSYYLSRERLADRCRRPSPLAPAPARAPARPRAGPPPLAPAAAPAPGQGRRLSQTRTPRRHPGSHCAAARGEDVLGVKY